LAYIPCSLKTLKEEEEEEEEWNLFEDFADRRRQPGYYFHYIYHLLREN
jgi:hypothetical protein